METFITALRRGPDVQAGVFNAVASTLFGSSLRLWSRNRGTRWVLAGTVTLSGEDNTSWTAPFETEPIAANTDRCRGGSRLASGGVERLDDDRLAELFFLDGLTVADLGELRGTKSTGGTDTWLFKALAGWLVERGVPRGHASAVLDVPIVDARRALFQALTAGAIDPFAAHLMAVYTDQNSLVGQVWAHSDWVAARRLFDALSSTESEPIPAAVLANRAGIPLKVAIGLSGAGRATRGKHTSGKHHPAVFTRNWGRLTQLRPEERFIETSTCAYCAGEGVTAHMVPVLCPEVSTYLLCGRCRRQNGAPSVVFPPAYLLRWSSVGRRQTIVTPAGERRVGSVLVPGEATAGTVFQERDV